MAKSNPGSWTDSMSGRERVRHVDELLDEPTPVQKSADRPEVSRATADDALKRLQHDDRVNEPTVAGTKAYEPNPVPLLFADLTEPIGRHLRESRATHMY